MTTSILPGLLTLVCLMGLFTGYSQPDDLRVNQDRIEARIAALAEFGIDDEGRNYRVAYTDGDIAGRQWFMQQMKEAGLDVSVDFAGNIIGKRSGTDPSLKPIVFGSHIDMVPEGGNYDGCVGSVGGLEVMQVLQENNIRTRHPLELIIFSDEEGGLIGSKALAGKLTPERLEVKSQSGLVIREGLVAIGGNPDRIEEMIRQKGDIAAFLELHIEQGAILDTENIQIGVVEGIVGIEQWEVTVEGFSNHSGTTPMNMRRDALLSAAEMIVAVNRVITATEGRQVGTVGRIQAMPGAYNVVPGKVVFGLEIRDLSREKIWSLFREIEKEAHTIAKSHGTTVTFKNQFVEVVPALTDPSIQAAIEQAAKSLGLSYQYMPSGAGHDAQDMAIIAPVGMIFVPSEGGISHSPKEFTSPEDMANGTNVLLHAILSLDKK